MKLIAYFSLNVPHEKVLLCTHCFNILDSHLRNVPQENLVPSYTFGLMIMVIPDTKS